MRWLRRNLVGIVAIAVLVYLFIPIAVIMVLSFNKPAGKYNLKFDEFSLEAWANLCGVPGVCSSFVTSIQIGIVSTIVATLLGTMIAFALVRYGGPDWTLDARPEPGRKAGEKTSLLP